MKKKASKNLQVSRVLNKVSLALLILTPVVYYGTAVFKGALCPPDSCGYAGFGIAAYALYFALITFALSIGCYLTSFVLKRLAQNK